jgi:ribosomal protein S3AE
MTMSGFKTQAIAFGKILKRIIKLGTTIFPLKKNIKYLGVILDQKLNFSKDIYMEKVKAQFNKILTLADR